MRKPELSDFGISQSDIAWAAKVDARVELAIPIAAAVGWAIYGLATAKTFHIGGALLLVVFIGFPLVLVTTGIGILSAGLLLRLFFIRYRQVDNYNSALRRFREWWIRTQRTFWCSLSGPQFESELAALYRRLGYRAELTSTSGDEGVDIWLYTERGREIVQCKAHRKPVGPAVVRELYGTIEHFKAPAGILASTSGFTRGVINYTQGKPIQLLGLTQIIAMQEKYDLQRSLRANRE